MVVTAWNPGELEDTSLPACHAMFQFFSEGDRLSLLMFQRSCDLFLGVPFNIAEYALLLHLVAQLTGREPHEFVHVLGDAHVYRDHFDAVRAQLERDPLPLPRITLDPALRTLDEVSGRYREILEGARRGDKPAGLLDGFARLEGYRHHEAIPAKMAV